MTRIAKLYEQLLKNPRGLTFAEFQRLLEAFGYRFKRQTGSHIAYRHTTVADTRIIQPKGKMAKLYQVEQFLDMIEKHALKLENGNDGSISH
jgi:predicted RNA binding protein YcfA (HicA-like mRNA interferase family)